MAIFSEITDEGSIEDNYTLHSSAKIRLVQPCARPSQQLFNGRQTTRELDSLGYTDKLCAAVTLTLTR